MAARKKMNIGDQVYLLSSSPFFGSGPGNPASESIYGVITSNHRYIVSVEWGDGRINHYRHIDLGLVNDVRYEDEEI